MMMNSMIGYTNNVASYNFYASMKMAGGTNATTGGACGAMCNDFLTLSESGLAAKSYQLTEEEQATLTKSAINTSRFGLRLNYEQKVRDLGGPDDIWEALSNNTLGPIKGEIGQWGGYFDFQLEEQMLNERINQTLKKAGVRLDKGEELNLKVDQDGHVTVGDGVQDDEKRAKIEQALNSNGNIGKDLLYSQAVHMMQQKTEDGSIGTLEMSTLSNPVLNQIITEKGLNERFGLSLSDFQQSQWNGGLGGEWENGLSFECTAEGYEDMASELFIKDRMMYFGIDDYLYDDTGQSKSFELEMTYLNGSLVRDSDKHAEEMPGIFSDRGDKYESLGRLIGLNVETTDKASFLEALEAMNTEETEALNSILTGLLGKAGLGDETREIVFAEDADGNIVIEGNLRADKKRTLERLINQDSELAERIKDHKAKQEIYRGLTVPENAEGELPGIQGHAFNADLSEERFTAARTQLLKSFLSENGGFSMDGMSTTVDPQTGRESLVFLDENGNVKNDEAFQSLMNDFWDLEDELINTVNRAAKTESSVKASDAVPIEINSDIASASKETRSLLSFHRGELTEATDEEVDFTKMAETIRKMVKTAVKAYNESVDDDNKKIVDFTFKIDDRGRLTIDEVVTKGGDKEQTQDALFALKKSAGGVTEETKMFAEVVLAEHDKEHGDTQEFKHFIKMGKDMGSDFEIISPDADKAALAEMQEIGGKLDTAFNDFFGTTFRDTFDIFWSAKDGLSLAEDFAQKATGKQVADTLNQLNERLASDDPKNDELFEDKLSVQLSGILDDLLKLKEAHSKLHEPTKEKVGMVFTVNPKD